MSSRKEEKARLRAEREAREAEEAKRRQRQERIQWVGGGALVIAAIAIVVVVIATGGGGNGGGSDAEPTSKPSDSSAAVKPPTANISDMERAAKAAGCDLKTGLEIEGAEHEDREFKPSDYKTNPPTSGNHFPLYPEDGVFAAGEEPPLGQQVHTLEHGRIDFQYKPGTDPKTIAQIEGLMAETDGYHQNLWRNATDMPYQVAAAAWGQLLGCSKLSPEAWDAFRAFRKRYTDKGPEFIP